MDRRRASALEEYGALLEQQQSRPLSPEQQQRLELLRDVLLELGALPTEEQPAALPVHPARMDAVMDVTFTTAEELVRAYSTNIGTGGLAIRTTRALPEGSAVQLRIKLPDAPQPVLAQGQVAWSRAEEMGVAFTQLPEETERHLRELLVRDKSLLKRVRNVLKADVVELLKTDVRELGKAPTQAAEAQEVDTRPCVLVRLSDAQQLALITELFAQRGLRVVTESDKPLPVVVVDTGTALEVVGASARLGTRIVLVNVSGPDSLVGKLSQLRPAAYVKRPASAVAVFQAVSQLLSAPAAH